MIINRGGTCFNYTYKWGKDGFKLQNYILSNKRNANFIFILWLSLKVSKMRVGVECTLQFHDVKCEERAVWVLRRCHSPCTRDKQISHGTPDAYSQHVYAQQQTTAAWDVFTDSLAIKEDPCTVAAGPIFDTDTMPKLTPAECERAVGLLTAGEDPRAVAVAFNVHLATIYRLQQRFMATGVTDDRPWTEDLGWRHRGKTAITWGTGSRQPTRLAGTPWGITRDLSAARQCGDGWWSGTGEPASSSRTGPYS